jgi:hypothetical protein
VGNNSPNILDNSLSFIRIFYKKSPFFKLLIMTSWKELLNSPLELALTIVMFTVAAMFIIMTYNIIKNK